MVLIPEEVIGLRVDAPVDRGGERLTSSVRVVVLTLAHLERVHRELQGEHIQDQITGAELTRKDIEITADYDVR